MNKLKLEELGLKPMSTIEAVNTDGGDTGYYGKGPDLDLAVRRVTYVAHQVGDFCRGFWNAIIN